jgi:diguanylate cyclase (GGDEF)-like protein
VRDATFLKTGKYMAGEGFAGEEFNLYRGALNALDDQICILDSSANIVFVNDSWVRFAVENGAGPDLRAEAWLGKSYLDACPSDDEDAAKAVAGIRQVLSGESERFSFEYPCHSPVAKRWFLLRVCRIAVPGRTLLLVAHLNITERRIAEQRAQALSLRDPLTGLSNRRHLDMSLHQEILRAQRDRSSFCLVILDLDHFKDLNDAQGHQRGDEFLSDVAEILGKACRRPNDVAARFGGDEFVLILDSTARSSAVTLMAKCRSEIAQLNAKYAPRIPVTVSIGIASSEDLPNLTAESLVRVADLALYEAKKHGRDTCFCLVASSESESQFAMFN